MTVAEATRAAVRERPFLFDALRAGVVNYTAAAAALDLDADADAVATALRRYADDVDAADPAFDARVTMERGLAPVADADADSDGDGVLLSVGGDGFVADGGDLTAVLATGDVGPRALERALGRLRTGGVGVEAAGVVPDALVVVVGRRDGAGAVRAVEAALDA